MPMYDYLCECGNHIESFFKMNFVPETVGCDCGKNAPRTFDPTLTMVRPRFAKTFEPIVVHRRKLDNGDYIYSYPANGSDAVDPGYEKVELSTLKAADRFVKDRNREEQEIRTAQIRGEQEYWANRATDRRAKAKVELEKRLGKSYSRIGDLVQKAVDARREKKYRDLANKDIGFHIQALAYDSQNHNEYRGPEKKISIVVNRSTK